MASLLRCRNTKHACSAAIEVVAVAHHAVQALEARPCGSAKALLPEVSRSQIVSHARTIHHRIRSQDLVTSAFEQLAVMALVSIRTQEGLVVGD